MTGSAACALICATSSDYWDCVFGCVEWTDEFLDPPADIEIPFEDLTKLTEGNKSEVLKNLIT